MLSVVYSDGRAKLYARVTCKYLDCQLRIIADFLCDFYRVAQKK